MGIPHESRELKKIVEMACFERVVAKLPMGFETDIREKGVNLSGGEKQRLALAGEFSQPKIPLSFCWTSQPAALTVLTN